ncbi:hypothetical protein GCM10008107_32030 [Psychrosphaera saromensis]|uniref:Lipoprotein n=1 Tax=Psychrosphaera saromensis TaxID=716813 RepID=A0A2S7UW02_9GAMM|nr:hypothetical protein [Psychrosphaera saromensis]PQJ54117.1 hypothetical protein BTO11_10945 [Psychrosphaera saromensis]GHB80235.1 hypothetical protein GCM10008107_32030 [Psychrosphaera saromensis]GLQ15212.1 hypothetical protein GCM10007917_26670 [Psychrosphaera saromensis]
MFMNRVFLVSALIVIVLFGCKPNTSVEVWNCFQETKINEDWIGISESTSEIRDGVYGETNSTVIVREISTNKESLLKSKVTFDFHKDGNSVEQTLITADWEIINDELNVFSEGRASNLLPSIGSTLYGTQESLDNGAVKTTYDSGLTTECKLVDDRSH